MRLTLAAVATATLLAAALSAACMASSTADGDALFRLFTENATYLGTDVTERWSVEAFEAFARPYFAQGRGWTYTPRERNLTLSPHPCRCVVWFDEVLDNAAYGTARGTGVLVLTEEGWRIGQYALTFPIPNDLARDFTARIREFEAAD